MRASTELGVTRIVPVLTARTVVTLEPGRWRERARRWQRVAKEAAKQCGRAVVPPVDVPRPLDEAFELLTRLPTLRLCLWEEALSGAAGGQGGGQTRLLGTTLAASLPPALPAGARVGLLIGPEGGLTLEEVESARARGWAVVGVGPRILRTETAGPAMIARAAGAVRRSRERTVEPRRGRLGALRDGGGRGRPRLGRDTSRGLRAGGARCVRADREARGGCRAGASRGPGAGGFARAVAGRLDQRMPLRARDRGLRGTPGGGRRVYGDRRSRRAPRRGDSILAATGPGRS